MVYREKKSKVVAAVCCLLMQVWTGALGEEIMSLYNDSSAQWWYILLHRGLQSRTNPRNRCVCRCCWCFMCAVFVKVGEGKGWISEISAECVSLYVCLPISVILWVTSVSCCWSWFCECVCVCARNFFVCLFLCCRLRALAEEGYD